MYYKSSAGKTMKYSRTIHIYARIYIYIYVYIKVIPKGNPKTYSAVKRNKRWMDFPFSLKSIGNKKSIIDSQTYLDFLFSFFKLFWSFIKYLKNSISFC